jgi:two-component system, NtrC family, response regulator
MADILIIDDDAEIRQTMESLLARIGHAHRTAATLSEGLKELASGDWDVVFLDISLPDGNGLDALPAVQAAACAPEIIVLTGRGGPEGAEIAIQGGVWDYLVKPASIKEIMLTLDRALKYREEKCAGSKAVFDHAGIVGASPAMLAAYVQAARAARTDAAALVIGETGTGKELFARTIHANSARSKGPFVVVDCAAMTPTLVESALFGHRKGAFTGADKDRPGLVAQADRGTLFLDEIGDLSLDIQKSFLRVLQEKRFRPVGANREEESDFRVIAATHRDLEAMAREGRFRQDLLFRLKTMTISLPPLRMRGDDFMELSHAYLDRLARKYNGPSKGVEPDFFEALAAYDWPGNVRELFGALERAFAASGAEASLYSRNLPTEIRIKAAKSRMGGAAPGAAEEEGKAGGAAFLDWEVSLRDFKGAMERAYLERLITRHGGDLDAMLRVSGLSRSHFYALLKKRGVAYKQA